MAPSWPAAPCGSTSSLSPVNVADRSAYQSQNCDITLVPRLCLGTHCLGGYASRLLSINGTSAGGACNAMGSQAEPGNQIIKSLNFCYNQGFIDSMNPPLSLRFGTKATPLASPTFQVSTCPPRSESLSASCLQLGLLAYASHLSTG